MDLDSLISNAKQNSKPDNEQKQNIYSYENASNNIDDDDHKKWNEWWSRNENDFQKWFKNNGVGNNYDFGEYSRNILLSKHRSLSPLYQTPISPNLSNLCTYCHSNIRSSCIEDHLYICPGYRTRCKYCDDFLGTKLEFIHHLPLCPKYIVICQPFDNLEIIRSNYSPFIKDQLRINEINALKLVIPIPIPYCLSCKERLIKKNHTCDEIYLNSSPKLSSLLPSFRPCFDINEFLQRVCLHEYQTHFFSNKNKFLTNMETIILQPGFDLSVLSWLQSRSWHLKYPNKSVFIKNLDNFLNSISPLIQETINNLAHYFIDYLPDPLIEIIIMDYCGLRYSDIQQYSDDIDEYYKREKKQFMFNDEEDEDIDDEYIFDEDEDINDEDIDGDEIENGESE